MNTITPVFIPANNSTKYVKCEHKRIEKYKYCPKCGENLVDKISLLDVLLMIIILIAIISTATQILCAFIDFCSYGGISTKEFLIEIIPGKPIYEFVMLLIERW